MVSLTSGIKLRELSCELCCLPFCLSSTLASTVSSAEPSSPRPVFDPELRPKGARGRRQTEGSVNVNFPSPFPIFCAEE